MVLPAARAKGADVSAFNGVGVYPLTAFDHLGLVLPRLAIWPVAAVCRDRRRGARADPARHGDAGGRHAARRGGLRHR
eukprot:scaffold102824_cov60-Phaeocystis_antarctica.AAC.3